MSAPRLRLAPRRFTRSAGLAACGLLIAVLAEASSVGLLALSGWFVAACAAAGASVSSTFSYLEPSGGVRALAVARIAGNYGKRIVLHAAALRRVAAARVRFYDSVAAASSPRGSGAWSGDLLDKAMAEADTAGMALIRDIAPALVAGVLTVAATGFMAVAGFPLSALVLLAGVAGCAVIAYRAPSPQSARESRTALRTEVVTAVDAWAEMASLGAADQLAARVTDRLEGIDAQQRSLTAGTARRMLLTGLVTVLTVAVVLLAMLAQSRTPDSPALVLMALLTTGVLANADQLAAAADARRDAQRARQQLRLEGRPTSPTPAVRVTLTDQRFGFADYVLPETVLRRQRSITADVPRGGILVVTGRSGSGKTTLLQAISTAVATTGAAVESGRRLVTSVWADDHLFTGTVGANLRLAQPDLDGSAATALLADMRLDRSGVSSDTPTGVGGRDLSGGEQRRIHIARAITTAPQVLVIDEPTSGLDRVTARRVLRALRQHLPDTTIVLAMHRAPTYLANADNTTIVSLD